MRNQIVPNLDGPEHICSSSDVTPLSASASARSFSKQPAWPLIFINSNDPGHKHSSLSRGSRISKCNMSLGCGRNPDFPHFMKINRSYCSGNRSRTRLKKCRRLGASARKEKNSPPIGAENCKRGILSLPNAKPAPIVSVRTHALPSVPLTQGTYAVSRPAGIDDTIRVLVVLDPDTSENRTSCLSNHPMHAG